MDIIPVNVLKAAGITPQQYAQMGTRQVMELVRLVYSRQLNNQSKNVLNKNN